MADPGVATTGSWKEKQVITPTTSLFPSTLATLERTPTVLRELMLGLPDTALDAKGPEGWSAHDVLAHLLSIHYKANVQRVHLIVENDNPAIPNVDEDEVLRESGMQAWPVSRLLDEYAEARAGVVAWLRTLPSGAFHRTGQHSVAGEISAADVLHHIAYHDLLHVGQIAKLLYAPLEERRGRMRDGFPDQ